MSSLQRPLPPMEAQLVDEIPEGDGWLYEPKWDGFRCVAFKDGEAVHLQSKAGEDLTRYFPDIVDAVRAVRAKGCVLDGEIVIPAADGGLSFDDLLLRIHPSDKRVQKLARETPGRLVVFDLLEDERGASLLERPLSQRRARLEAFAAKRFPEDGRVTLSPATDDRGAAEGWLRGETVQGLDGVMAKRLDAPYRSGERDAMRKIKRMRTADCVVGGFRYAQKSKALGSLLLGLYDEEGLLHHVGFCSAMSAQTKGELLARLVAMEEAPGFTGRAPGGKSRWASERSTEWTPVRPELVVEVRYDHWSQGRFRHGTKLLRLRPDKAPRQCTFEQVRAPGAARAAAKPPTRRRASPAAPRSAAKTKKAVAPRAKRTSG